MLQDHTGRPVVNQRSAWRADLASYGQRPFLRERSIYAVAIYRFGRWNDLRHCGAFSRRLATYAFWIAYRIIEVATGISLPKEADFGPGLRIHHSGTIVIHPSVTAGANCVLRHGVTLGERRVGGGAPRLGDDVEVGAYGQILGPLTVGSRAKIGAMALVLIDIPADGVAHAPAATLMNRSLDRRPSDDEHKP